MTSFPGSAKGIYLASMNPAMNVSRPSASLLASAARRWTASASSTSYEKNVQCFKHIQQSLAEVQMVLASRPPGRAADKLTTWEKVQLIRDQGAPLLQLSPLAGYWTPYGKVANAGMLSALTRVAGRSCMILANDWAHKGGTVFPITLKKQLRAQEVAAQNDLPCVYIVDSGGAFLPLQAEIFPDKEHGGRVFRNEAVMSSKGIPQIAVVCGSCTAGGAYVPTMCDEAVMVDRIGALYLAGPPLVKAATGETISSEELGGAQVHCSVSGCVDHFGGSEEEGLQRVREVLGSTNGPGSVARRQERADPEPGASLEEFARLLPSPDDVTDCGNFPMLDVVEWIVDGGVVRQFKALYGTTLITGFAHVGGHLVGIVANVGEMTTEACLKGTHFTELCGKRGIPLIFLHNTGRSSAPGATKAKACMMAAVACLQVPKIAVIVASSFGTSSYAMCNRAMSPNFVFSWPHARMGIGDIGHTASEHEEAPEMTGEECSWRLLDDGLILPHQTKEVLTSCLELCSPPQESTQQSPVMRF